MGLEFDAEEVATIERIAARYPTRAAALLPVLHLAQDKFGALPVEAQLLVANTLDVPPTRVREVVTFYEMFHEHPEGQFHLELCTNIACHLQGADLLMKHLQERLGIAIGHQTEDGMFSLMEVECLASCGSGTMMKVGMDYYEHLDEAAIDTLLEKFKKLAPSLNGRPYVNAKSGPHTGPVPGHNPRLPVVHPQQPAPVQPPKPEVHETPAASPLTPSDEKPSPSATSPEGGAPDPEKKPLSEKPPVEAKDTITPTRSPGGPTSGSLAGTPSQTPEGAAIPMPRQAAGVEAKPPATAPAPVAEKKPADANPKGPRIDPPTGTTLEPGAPSADTKAGEKVSEEANEKRSLPSFDAPRSKDKANK